MSGDHDESIKMLIERFPDFIEGVDLTEGPCSVLGDFAIYVRDGIDQNTLADSEVRCIFDFLNELGDSPDSDVKNQLAVGILEILTDSDSVVKTCKERLRGDALFLFHRALDFWRKK